MSAGGMPANDPMDLLPEILVKKHSGSADVHPESRLFTDLGMDGDDASEFLQAFSQRFDIDWTGFHWLRYFGDEGIDVFAPVFSVVAQSLSANFRQRWKAAREAEREITVAHLARVAEAKRWIEPPDAARRQSASLLARLPGTVFMSVATISLTFLWAVAIISLLSGSVTDPVVPSASPAS